MAGPGPRNDLTDISGLSVGSAHDLRIATGTSLVLCERPFRAAVDVRGGGACTRETDVMNPAGLVETVDAVVLSGGSVYGLAAADAVTAALSERGTGFALFEVDGVPVSPIVPAACLYDLANGGDKRWGRTPPYSELGFAALDDALAGTPVRLGREGAGYGAGAGAHPGAVGSASWRGDDGITVAAFVAVNCFGSVTMPGQDDVYWAWPYEIAGEFGGARPDPARAFELDDWGAAKFNPGARTQTTLAVVATDADLTRDETRRLAVMAQDGLARAIRPVHAPVDGDVVFALSGGSRPLAEPRALDLTRLGALAADCLSRAIARGVHAARSQVE
ncbi:MAG: P1 family peptidase [Alphaproteobacteria bacterium]|nr:P1 family peptidase [Alphaproteobacteria bacterium]